MSHKLLLCRKRYLQVQSTAQSILLLLNLVGYIAKFVVAIQGYTVDEADLVCVNLMVDFMKHLASKTFGWWWTLILADVEAKIDPIPIRDVFWRLIRNALTSRNPTDFLSRTRELALRSRKSKLHFYQAAALVYVSDDAHKVSNKGLRYNRILIVK
jgi:hypothetical protein